MRYPVLLSPVLLLPCLGQGAQPIPLETVTVTAPRQSQALLDTPAAVTVVDSQAHGEGRPNLQLDETLNRVPGLFFQNRYNFAQNLRISSRGFGARAPFGVRGLHLRVDGLPYTLPDGQSQVDAIDLDRLRQVEVLRGPASSLYGNAAGGVLLLNSDDGGSQPPGAHLRVAGGSDDYRKLGATLYQRDENNDYALGVSALSFDGQRQQSRVEKYQLNGKWRHALANGGRITTLLEVLDIPTAEDPGGLTRAQAHQDRDQASRFSNLLDAGQVVRQQRLGWVWDQPTEHGAWQGYLHYTHRDFEQQLPFPGSSELGYERQFYGTGLRHAGQAGKLNYVVGAEVNRQEDDRDRYQVSASGARQGRTADEQQNATAAGLFAQATLPLNEYWSWTLGGRLDRLQLSIDDRFLADGDDDGHRRFTERSYSTGLNWRLHPRHQLFANIGSAFESPTFTEFANPDGGGFNPDLEPQKAVNGEIGARGDLSGTVQYELTLFTVRTRDEIVPFEQDGRTFYENAGRTRRDGVELGLSWYPDDWNRISAAWTYGNYRFRRFQENGESLRDHRLPGLPEHQLYLEWQRDYRGGTFTSLETLMISSVYAENGNDTRVGGYALVNGRIGHRWRLAGGHQLTTYLAAHNLLDRDYYANIRINANSDRPLASRGYFEPGPGRTWVAGMEIRL